MGKTSKRPGREERDVHAAIREEAAQAMSRPSGGASDSKDWPALDALMRVCRAELVDAIPEFIDYHGRRYFLRVHLVMTELEVFDGPGKAVPLMRGALGLIEGAGHVRGH